MRRLMSEKILRLPEIVFQKDGTHPPSGFAQRNKIVLWLYKKGRKEGGEEGRGGEGKEKGGGRGEERKKTLVHY